MLLSSQNWPKDLPRSYGHAASRDAKRRMPNRSLSWLLGSLKLEPVGYTQYPRSPPASSRMLPPCVRP